MKNKNRNINLYTQGQRLAARVLFMVGLLGNCGLGSVLAVPGGQGAVLDSKASGSVLSRVLSCFGGDRNAAPLVAYETTAGPVAEGVKKSEIKAISKRGASNVGDLDTLLEATKDANWRVRSEAIEVLVRIFPRDKIERKAILNKLIQLTKAPETVEDILKDAVKAFGKLTCITGPFKLTSTEKDLIQSALIKVKTTTWAGIEASEVLSKLRPS